MKPDLEHSLILATLSDTSKLVRYIFENNTSNNSILYEPPQDLEFSSICMMQNGNLLIPGGYSGNTRIRDNEKFIY